jgi:hypothetical protein
LQAYFALSVLRLTGVALVLALTLGPRFKLLCHYGYGDDKVSSKGRSSNGSANGSFDGSFAGSFYGSFCNTFDGAGAEQGPQRARDAWPARAPLTALPTALFIGRCRARAAASSRC